MSCTVWLKNTCWLYGPCHSHHVSDKEGSNLARCVKPFPLWKGWGKDHQHTCPLCSMMHPKTKVHWASPPVFVPWPRGTNAHTAANSLPVLHFAVHLLPCSFNTMCFKVQDGCMLNELTLRIFDNGEWWPSPMRMTHKEAFCFASCFFVLFFRSVFFFRETQLYCKEKGAGWGKALSSNFSIYPHSFSVFFFVLFCVFFYTIFTVSCYLLFAPAPSFYPEPSLGVPALPVLQQI